MDNDSMDSDSMVGRMGRMDKSGKMGIDNVDVVFCDVSHNRHNRSHHHRFCHIDCNQIVSLLFPPFDFNLGYAM
jgi:hypothetical protein